MGLDTSHDCWHGGYGSFMQWRTWVAKESGIPLRLMEGFYDWTWEEGDFSFDRDYGPIHAANPVHDVAHCWRETLDAMARFGKGIPWSIVADKPLVALLHHSDCDGRIKLADCLPLARSLHVLLRRVPDDARPGTDWRTGHGCYDGMVPATKRFIRGLLEAHRLREDVTFG